MQMEDHQTLINFARAFPGEFAAHVKEQQILLQYHDPQAPAKRLSVEQQLILHSFYFRKRSGEAASVRAGSVPALSEGSEGGGASGSGEGGEASGNSSSRSGRR